MLNLVQNEIIFENASDEKVAALIRESMLADEEGYETSYINVTVDDDSDSEVTEIGEPETVDSGLSISDLI